MLLLTLENLQNLDAQFKPPLFRGKQGRLSAYRNPINGLRMAGFQTAKRCSGALAIVLIACYRR